MLKWSTAACLASTLIMLWTAINCETFRPGYEDGNGTWILTLFSHTAQTPVKEELSNRPSRGFCVYFLNNCEFDVIVVWCHRTKKVKGPASEWTTEYISQCWMKHVLREEEHCEPSQNYNALWVIMKPLRYRKQYAWIFCSDLGVEYRQLLKPGQSERSGRMKSMNASGMISSSAWCSWRGNSLRVVYVWDVHPFLNHAHTRALPLKHPICYWSAE